jgi:hypothetical protein
MAFTANPQIVYSVLKTELATNPQSLGATVGGTNYSLLQLVTLHMRQDCANVLNAAGSVVGATVPTGPLTVGQFWQRVVAAEELALTPQQRGDKKVFMDEYLAMLGGVPLNDPGTWAIISSYYPATAPIYSPAVANTNTQLAALKTRPCSRAETLFGADVRVAWQDVAYALEH